MVAKTSSVTDAAGVGDALGFGLAGGLGELAAVGAEAESSDGQGRASKLSAGDGRGVLALATQAAARQPDIRARVSTSRALRLLMVASGYTARLGPVRGRVTQSSSG